MRRHVLTILILLLAGAVVIFAVVGAVSGLLFARCRLRVHRGLCPACAYPVGTSSVCRECG